MKPLITLVFNPDEQVTLNVNEIRPYTTKELCNIYRVSDKTFYKWLVPFRQEIGVKTSRFYTVRQVETIISNLGMPYSIKHQNINKQFAA